MRKILAITGTRADYGIQHPVYAALRKMKSVNLRLVVCGMHLSTRFGKTIGDIRRDGFPIAATVDTLPKEDTRAAMAQYVGESIIAFAAVFTKEQPDLVLVLGDRGEMLAAAVAAAELDIPIVHLHGGEESGTVDDVMRNAITQLSAIHCTSAPRHTGNVRRMRGRGVKVFTVGAPALDVIRTFTPLAKRALLRKAKFDPSYPTVIFVQHPDTLSSLSPQEQIARSIKALQRYHGNLLIIGANADAGGRLFNERLAAFARRRPHTRFFITIAHREYLSWLKVAHALVGNSSSGIIEAASFHLPVVNIGSRQRGRLRSGNVLDVPHDAQKIANALQRILTDERLRARLMRGKNAYGDGHAAERIARILSSIPLPPRLP